MGTHQRDAARAARRLSPPIPNPNELSSSGFGITSLMCLPIMHSEMLAPSHCTNSDGIHSSAVPAGRAYLCALCHCRANICPQCDRGQIYCSKSCSQKARRSRQREAGRRYQVSDRGRLLHAERSRRYRDACRAVTHHGLPQEASVGTTGDERSARAAAMSVSWNKRGARAWRRCHST